MRRAGLAAAACLASACGLAPQERFTGERHADGVAPWQHLGALELCLGETRVGPAARPAGGTCTPAGAQAATCDTDADCQSREACVCGACTVRFCSTNAECRAPQVCDFGQSRCARPCGDARDCGGGEVCVSGFCTGECATDDQCQLGEVCSSMGRCITAACEDDTGCLGGERCRVQRVPRRATEPTVLVEDGRFVLWLEMDDGAGGPPDIWRAESDNGRDFRLGAAGLLGPGEWRAPSVVRAGDGVRLFVQTPTGISASDSADGVTFPAPVEVLAGDFRAPAAARLPSGEILVLAQVGDGESLALWREGGALTTFLTPEDVTDPFSWRRIQRIGSPYLRVETAPSGDLLLRLWFHAFGEESQPSEQFGETVPLPPNDSIGYASALVGPSGPSAPPVLWPFNPVFDRTVAFLDHRGERAPAATPAPGGRVWYLYFHGTSGDGTLDEGLHVSRNPPEIPR